MVIRPLGGIPPFHVKNARAVRGRSAPPARGGGEGPAGCREPAGGCRRVPEGAGGRRRAGGTDGRTDGHRLPAAGRGRGCAAPGRAGRRAAGERSRAGGGRRRGAAGGRRWVPGRSGAPVPPRRYPAGGEARPAAAALRPPRAAAAPRPASAPPGAEPFFPPFFLFFGGGRGGRGSSHPAVAGGSVGSAFFRGAGLAAAGRSVGAGAAPPAPSRPLPRRCPCVCALMTVILRAMLQRGRVCGAARAELYNAPACQPPSRLRP